MANNFPYKSICWKFGTTSFRTKNFNKTIEEQLSLIDEFWSRPENSADSWSSNDALQIRYYNFMHERGFLVGSAANKPKDAREKTSGLVDIGLIDDARRLTDVGSALLDISRRNDFAADNELQLPKDSYIYLKQLLKTAYDINGDIVRPFLVLLALLTEFRQLTREEFTYLLPLCSNVEMYTEIVAGIKRLRLGECAIDEIIVQRLMSMANYQAAQEYFLAHDVTEALVCDIGMNRKSRNYDKPYYGLYKALYKVFVKQQDADIVNLLEATHTVKIGNWWREYLFDTVNKKAINKAPRKHLRSTRFDSVTSLLEFKTVFFQCMHLFKLKATLADYFDLNRRYVKTTDIVLFEDNEVKLDVIPHYFFRSAMPKLKPLMFKADDSLECNVKLNDIDSCLVLDDEVVIRAINSEMGVKVNSLAEARSLLANNRYQRLNHLIDTTFTDENILALLDMFEKRKDKDIHRMINAEADIPTMFEYVLGILWYKVSGRTGKILDYMKLSLDADLLPKTHAAGGEADIVYEYKNTKHYPQHTLLLEATLADSTNQRRMEMEPVSRHLGQHLLASHNDDDYCVFITNNLNINVIADFRGRKTTPYYDTTNAENFVCGMKIIPLETGELKNIIRSKMNYSSLYKIFANAHKSDLLPREWYTATISKVIDGNGEI